MTRILTLAALFLTLCTASYAAESIYFKIANDDGYINFLNVTDGSPQPMVNEIAVSIIKRSFTPSTVRGEYYDLSVSGGIQWKGAEMVQYDYNPRKKDRSRYVFWVDNVSGETLKLDIFDTGDTLLYSAIVLERSAESAEDPRIAPPPALKQLPPDVKGYLGFVNVQTQRSENGTARMHFTDGLNRFTVFRAPSDGKEDAGEKLVVYGNYVYNRNVAKFRYTVVGSIPFERMEEIVKMISINIENDAFTPTQEVEVEENINE